MSKVTADLAISPDHVAIAGGAADVNGFPAAGVIDELRVHVAPVVPGAGERLLAGVGDPRLEPIEVSGTARLTHLRYRVVR